MQPKGTTGEYNRPFPALTPAQRYHFDVFGYVVIENTLTENEVGTLREALQKLKRDFLASGDPTSAVVRRARVSAYKPHHMHFSHVMESDPAILDYLAHPRLLAMVEEVVGGSVRIEESEAIINARDPHADPNAPLAYGFHTGTRPQYGTYTENGLYHCNFVKTLTNLTDLGPDDGGTVCIAGSHKIQCSEEEIIACAYADPALIHQVIAPAGSTLLFGEALIHATGHIRCDRERVIVIGGYTPPMFQAWQGQEPSAKFVAQTPEALRPLVTGSDKWRWQRRFRSLGMQPEQSSQ